MRHVLSPKRALRTSPEARGRRSCSCEHCKAIPIYTACAPVAAGARATPLAGAAGTCERRVERQMRHRTLAERRRSSAAGTAALHTPQHVAPAGQHVASRPLRRSMCAASLLAVAVLLCPGRPKLPGQGLLAAAQVPAGTPGLSCTVVTDVSSPWQPQTVRFALT